ncbi:DUF507 family protein [bacterium]|nr:DUF507 family protein [bacterium]
MASKITRAKLDFLAQRVVDAMAKSAGTEIRDAEAIKSVVRNAIVQNLADEERIEAEVMETLRAHGQQIFEANADFQKMLAEGKKILAKKKGFVL